MYLKREKGNLISKLGGKAYISSLLFSWIIFKNLQGEPHPRRMACHAGRFKVQGEIGAREKAKDNLIIRAKFLKGHVVLNQKRMACIQQAFKDHRK